MQLYTKSKRSSKDNFIYSSKRIKVKREDANLSIKTNATPCLEPNEKTSNVAQEPDTKFTDVLNERKLKHIKVEIELDTRPPNIFDPVSEADIKSIPSSTKVPVNWHRIYNEIVIMRSKFMSPVDTMGCERMPETITPNLTKLNPKIYRFQLLISLMLSSQTKDEVNFEAMKRLQSECLKKGYPDGLCLQAVLGSNEVEIDEYILKIGFHKRKASFIKRTCDMLMQSFDGDIPRTIEEIVTLPGVGPKMGFLLLQKGWGINDGIGVDVHLHRLAQMWGWVSKSEKPETTRKELEDWLPRSLWTDINPLLVGFGQTICAPRAKNCDICSLGRQGICKSSDKKLVKRPMSEARMMKLKKQRADLSALIDLT